MTRLAYFEWSAPDDADLDDPEAWAQANPALGAARGNGTGISEDFVRSERQALFMASGSDDDWIRERLGIFPEDIDATETVIDEAHWQACSAPHSKIADAFVLAFEVSADRKRTVIASAGPSTITGTHVEVIENRAGTGWVVNRLIELRDKHKPSAIVCNPSGGSAGLLPELERAKVDIVACKGPDYTQACEDAIHAIADARWCHIEQASLTAAVTGAGKRVTGDSWVFDRRGLLDISPLIAVVLGAWAVGRHEEPEPFFFYA